MLDFRFLSPTEIIFGKGTETAAGEECKKYGKKVLFHYGGQSIKKSGLYDAIVASLKAAGLDFVELGGVQPNPRLRLVREGIRLCREEGVDFILAVGGGSVIDSAKAIALGVPYGGDVWDFYIGQAQPGQALPTGAVLTLPATGSEASRASVITDQDSGLKRSVNFEPSRPRFAIMNPELTFTLPPFQTACGVADIMSHAMERYFTAVPHVELTDRLCEAVLKTVINNAPMVLSEPENYDARAEIMWAGTLAHNDLLTTGRVSDFASHMIEHELSAFNDVAHGAGLAIVFPAWMRYVYKHDVARFVRFAAEVWNVEPSYFLPERTALEGIKRLRAFFRSLGLPVSLAEIGVYPEHFEALAKNTRRFKGGKVGNFVKLDTDDIIEILRLAQ
jgi:alcohol dehydrogenase YqhD (iron-dependent ADH family)